MTQYIPASETRCSSCCRADCTDKQDKNRLPVGPLTLMACLLSPPCLIITSADATRNIATLLQRLSPGGIVTAACGARVRKLDTHRCACQQRPVAPLRALSIPTASPESAGNGHNVKFRHRSLLNRTWRISTHRLDACTSNAIDLYCDFDV